MLVQSLLVNSIASPRLFDPAHRVARRSPRDELYPLKSLAALIVALALGPIWHRLRQRPNRQCERVAIFPANPKHNHASCVVELKDGSLLAAWYAGSGERKADDVVIEGARLGKGKTAWGPKFLMADTPGYPDCNPALFAAPDGSLWLFWPTILDHRWEGALLKYARSRPARRARPPRGNGRRQVSCTSRPKTFAAEVEQAIAALSDEEKSKYRQDPGRGQAAGRRRALSAAGLDAAGSSARASFGSLDLAALFRHVLLPRSWRSPTIGVRPGRPAGP